MKNQALISSLQPDARNMVFILMGIFVLLVLIVVYVLFSSGCYNIARAKRVKNPFLAYIPVAQGFLFGKIADTLAAEKKRKTYFRHILLWSQIGIFFFIALYFVRDYVGVLSFFSLSTLIVLEIICLLAVIVTNYVCAHKIYAKYDKKNARLYTLLSIIAFLASPVFLYLTSVRAVNYYKKIARGY